jgi:hypothetical protein
MADHKSTHADGVLKDKLGIDVNTGKTIGEHVGAVQNKTSEEIALEYVTAFAKEAKAKKRGPDLSAG